MSKMGDLAQGQCALPESECFCVWRLKWPRCEEEYEQTSHENFFPCIICSSLISWVPLLVSWLLFSSCEVSPSSIIKESKTCVLLALRNLSKSVLVLSSGVLVYRGEPKKLSGDETEDDDTDWWCSSSLLLFEGHCLFRQYFVLTIWFLRVCWLKNLFWHPSQIQGLCLLSWLISKDFKNIKHLFFDYNNIYTIIKIFFFYLNITQ